MTTEEAQNKWAKDNGYRDWAAYEESVPFIPQKTWNDIGKILMDKAVSLVTELVAADIDKRKGAVIFSSNLMYYYLLAIINNNNFWESQEYVMVHVNKNGFWIEGEHNVADIIVSSNTQSFSSQVHKNKIERLKDILLRLEEQPVSMRIIDDCFELKIML